MSELHRRLIAAARTAPPDDAVPPGFEYRVMARIRSAQMEDPSISWAVGLWRAVIPALALLAVVGGLHLHTAGGLSLLGNLGADTSLADDELDRVLFGTLEPAESW